MADSSLLCLFLWMKFFVSILLRLWKHFRMYQISILSGLLWNFLMQIEICSNKFCVSASEKYVALGVQKIKTSCTYMQISIPILREMFGDIWVIGPLKQLSTSSSAGSKASSTWTDKEYQGIMRWMCFLGYVSSASLAHSLSDCWLPAVPIYEVFQ